VERLVGDSSFIEGEALPWSEAELIEWFSGQAQAYFVGKAGQSWHVPIPQSVRVWLEKMRAFLTELFNAARHLMRLEAEGKLDAGFQLALQQAVGLDPAWAAALRYEGQYEGDAAGQELKAIARGQASGIGDYAGVFLSQRKDGATREAGDSQATYQLRAFHERRHAQAQEAGQTDLTAPQWQQVHSPEFKAWFGDWQKLRAEQRIDAMKPVELALDESFRGKSPEELRKAVVMHLRSLAKDGVKAVHPELGEVGFADNKIGKVINTSAATKKLHATLDIVRVIEAAHLVESNPSYKKGQAERGFLYHTLGAKVNAFGREFVTVITVEQGDNGNLFYNNIALESGYEKAPAVSPRGAQSEDSDAASAFTGAEGKQLGPLRRVNPETVSKAINPRTGEPLVVYHGTTKSFEAFDLQAGNKNVYPGAVTDAAFFTDNPTNASSYAGRKDAKEYLGSDGWAMEVDWRTAYGEGGNVIPVFLFLKNPLIVNAEGNHWHEIHYEGEWVRTGELVDIAHERGHDGLIVRNVKDYRHMGNKGESDTLKASTSFAVLSPEQRVFAFADHAPIKSAVGNRGTFDASNPDITYQLRSVGSEGQNGMGGAMPEASQSISPEERAQFLAHQKFLTGEPVARLTGEEFAEQQGGKLRFRIADWYAKRRNSVVDVEGLGSIKLDSRAIEQSLRHGGKGRPKVAAFAAVPDVLRKGRVIHREPLHGTKDGDFVHVAAPIEIGGIFYITDVVVKADRNGSRMYLHDVVLKEALRLSAYASENTSRGGDVAASTTEQQSASADAGVVETVLRRIFSVKEDEGSTAAPSPSHQLRPLSRADQKAAKKQQIFEASGVPQTLLQEIDARLERIRARQIGQEDLSRAAEPVAAATREAGIVTRGVRVALDRWAEPIARRFEKINPVLGQTLRRLEFDMGRGRVAAWEKVKPLADGLAQLAKAAPADYVALDLALKNGERGQRDALLIKHGLADAWGPVEFLLRTYHAKLSQAGFKVGFLENYFPRKVVNAEGLLDYYAGDEAAVEAVNEATQSKEDAGKFFAGLFGIPQNLKERTVWEVTPKTMRFYASPVEALQTYIEQVNEALTLKAFFGGAAVFTGKDEAGKVKTKAGSGAQLGELFGMDIGKSIGKHVERLRERDVLSAEQGLEVTQMLRVRFNKLAQWKWLQGVKNVTLLTTLGHYTTTPTQVGDLAFALYEAGVFHTLAEAKTALKSESKVTKEAVGIDAIAEGFKDPSKLSKAVDWVFKKTGFEHMDRVGKEAIMNAKLAQLQEEALNGEFNAKAQAMLEASFERSAHAKIIADLREGRQTPDTLFLAYSTLANFQPVSLSEYPQTYLNNPNGRIFYLLKTFTLKALSAMRREGISKIVHGKTVTEKAEGFKNLIVLAGLMYLLGVPIDALKDWLMGRDPRLEDLHVDNLLKLVGVNRWAVWRARDGHIFQAAWAVIGPPKPWMDYPWSDWEKIHKEQQKGLDADLSKLESWKLIPIIGRPYYWHFGGGADKVKRRKENQGK